VPDPEGIADNVNVYSYVRQRPIVGIDLTGTTTFIVIGMETWYMPGDHLGVFVESETGDDFFYDPAGSFVPRGAEREGPSRESDERPPDEVKKNEDRPIGFTVQDYVSFQNKADAKYPEGYDVVVYAINTTVEEEEQLRSIVIGSEELGATVDCTFSSTLALSKLDSGRFWKIFGWFDITPMGAEKNLRDANRYDWEINRVELPGNVDDKDLPGLLQELRTFEPPKPFPVRVTLDGVDYVIGTDGEMKVDRPPAIDAGSQREWVEHPESNEGSTVSPATVDPNCDAFDCQLMRL
jgi:hypothetical protein